MDETDYIVATDLALVRIMLKLLAELQPESNTRIQSDEWKAVASALRHWEDRMNDYVMREGACESK